MICLVVSSTTSQAVADNPHRRQTSSRPREIGGSFASRRGHGPQLSISDTNHHVTEAIGDMYGDDDFDSKRDSRPLSFIASPLHDTSEEGNRSYDSNARTRPPLSPGSVNGTKAKSSPAKMSSSGQRRSSLDGAGGPLSPSLSLRERTPSDTASQQFPLNDIDYESDPAAVAQELSNLQALRRMSMDVGNTSDPDLPSFQGVSLMPSVAPTGDDDEDDPSRLFWVPAKVHPELAPMEFKKFLENRVTSIKRRSGEQQTSLSPEGLERSASGSGLRRKKSMLSRQIDNSGGRGAVGYEDGAEQLERKKSLAHHLAPELKISDLQELDALVKDPSKAMQKLSLDTTGRQDSGGEVASSEDMPILPAAPGIGLRRSTRTTYRRGSLRKGERVPFSKRAGSLRSEQKDAEELPASSSIDGRSAVGYPLTKVPSEPSTAENFSRPTRGGRRLQNVQQTSPTSTNSETILEDVLSKSTEELVAKAAQEPREATPQPGSLPRSSTFPRSNAPVPQIIETPPQPEAQPVSKPGSQFPERSSSQPAPPSQPKQPVIEPPARSNKRPSVDRQASSNSQPAARVSSPNQTLNEMAQQPSPLLGHNGRTDSLTFIPTLEEKKPEKKLKKEKDDESGKKSTWGWFKGSDEKDKKGKKKEDGDKSKMRNVVDKVHDNARLDVLQSSIETGVAHGRESLLLDRDSIENKLEGERKKESGRKSSEAKKEKDGLFSSFFGGGKKKADRDSGGKKGSSLRTLSPEPPQRQLKPDIDYNWTRFSILEERAIYRMAHIKLANPRRALYSQVLLSNFMYSYLAKVQQMHPHMQIPQSAQQKKAAEAERKAKEQEQQYREQQEHQSQHLESGEQYRYDYHQGIAQYAESDHSQKPEGVDYVDDSQIYDHDHQHDDYSHGHGSGRPQSRTSHNTDGGYGYGDQGNPQYERQGNNHYQYGQQQHDHDDDDDDDMW